MFAYTEKQKKKHDRGFTLIELLLYMAIATMLVIAISSVSTRLLWSAESIELTEAVTAANAFILQTIEQTAENAYAISEPGGTGTTTEVIFRMYEAAVDPTKITTIDDAVYLIEGTADPVLLHATSVRAQVVFTPTPPQSFDAVAAAVSTRARFDRGDAFNTPAITISKFILLHYTP